jgi:dethiobiotin synthetase
VKAHFITGTGTDIGKTWLACALLRHWRAEGRQPAAIKPVLSGFDPLRPQASDAGALLTALGREASNAELDAIAPWRFAAPLSPDMAAAREGRRIDFQQLVGFTRRAASADSCATLVEGVGGVMAPLDATHTVRDWIAASGLPCVLVAGSYLGSLSHTLTALEALQRVGAGVTAIAVNESPGSTVSLDATLETLSRHAHDIPLVGIERAGPQAGMTRLAGLLCPNPFRPYTAPP